jgi:hypothetical protein
LHARRAASSTPGGPGSKVRGFLDNFVLPPSAKGLRLEYTMSYKDEVIELDVGDVPVR